MINPPVPLRNASDIAAAIRTRRRHLGLDQAELARRIGASRLWVSQIERGKPGASLMLVLRAFSALGVDLVAVEPGDRGGALSRPPLPDLDLNLIVDGLRRKAEP